MRGLIVMRSLLVSLLLLSLSACMSVSDMADGVGAQLSDAGVLDHSRTYRLNSRHLQADSFIYIGQGPFVPPGNAYPRPNVVAEEAFAGFIQYFPLVQRAPQPLGLDAAMGQARTAGANYLLYARFAAADDRIGNTDEWQDQEALDRLGVDHGVVQLMLIETSTRYLVDSAQIRSRGGLFNSMMPSHKICWPRRCAIMPVACWVSVSRGRPMTESKNRRLTGADSHAGQKRFSAGASVESAVLRRYRHAHCP